MYKGQEPDSIPATLPPPVKFTVPYLTPPSVNHYKEPCTYRDKTTGEMRKGMRKTKDAIAYTAAVCTFARGDTVAPTDPKEQKKVIYGVSCKVYLGKGTRLDADNGGKLLLDSLQTAGVIHSDAFVGPFTAEVIKTERHNPRTEFHVWRVQ